MDAGLAGRPSSLAMIPTYVTIDKPVPASTPVTVMDAGGTNLRVATIRFSAAGVPDICDLRKATMPGIGTEVSKDEFFRFLADMLRPLAAASPRVGCCFSYPTEITPDCDGKLLYWTKEIRAPEVEGSFVGAELNRALVASGCGSKRVVILNDTIATLLAGKSFGSARRYSNYTGVIVGTGSNTAYVEDNARIAKLPGLPPGAMSINLESGNFAKCPRSDIDLRFDSTLANPGRQVLEKMISGGYLGGLALHVLRVAAEEGLLSASAGAVLNAWKDLPSEDLSALLANPFQAERFRAGSFAEADLEMMMRLCAEVVRRAALMIAINISTPVLKSGSGRNPLHPVCITVDGSTYYKTPGLRSLVEEDLRRILGRRGIHFEVLQVDEAPLIGAAVAGLTV
jgi:hexokinase